MNQWKTEVSFSREGKDEKKKKKRGNGEPSDEMVIGSPFLLLHDLISFEVLLHREPSRNSPVGCTKTNRIERNGESACSSFKGGKEEGELERTKSVLPGDLGLLA